MRPGAADRSRDQTSREIWCVIRPLVEFHEFAAVSVEEMAFALTLFVEAGNQRLSYDSGASPLHWDDGGAACALLYGTLCADCEPASVGAAVALGQEASLYAAFHGLCSAYQGDPMQAAICARVLAFHFLMERTAGAVVAGWVEPVSETPGLVTLHPAVIEAVAQVPLRGTVRLAAGVFRQVLEEVGTRN